MAEAKRVRAINKGKAMENAEKRASEAMSADWEEQEEVKQTEIRSREAIRVAAKLAWQKKEEEEKRALVKYAQNVKKIAEAKRVRAINKGRALEQGEREAAVTSLSSSSSSMTVTSDVAPVVKRTTMFAGAFESVVNGVQSMFLDRSRSEEENPFKEAEALARYANKVKLQQLAADQNNARSKGQALENAELVAMKSQMLREEAEAKARMEEEEDRQARATAVRRKEAEEAAAAVSYAKSVKKLDEAKRTRAINKLKALEQAGEYVRQPAPSTDAGVPVIAAATIATATGTIVESTYRNTPTTAEQEALAMYAKKINPTKIANSATTEAEALALYQKSLKAQQYAAAVINARNKGQALENAELVAMKSQMLREEAEAKARMEEEEDRQARATAVRRKEAEEAAAAVSYAKSVQRVEDAKRARAINKLKALEQAGEYVRQLAPSIASQFVLSTSTVDLKEQQARRLLNAIISVEARDTVPEAAARNRISIRLEKTTDMTQANEDVDQRKSTVQSNALATVVVEREASETGKASPLTASRTVMDFVVSALRAVRTLVWVDHRSE